MTQAVYRKKKVVYTYEFKVVSVLHGVEVTEIAAGISSHLEKQAGRKKVNSKWQTLNSQSHLSTQTSSNKPIPPKPHQTVPPTGDQAFKCLRLCGHLIQTITLMSLVCSLQNLSDMYKINSSSSIDNCNALYISPVTCGLSSEEVLPLLFSPFRPWGPLALSVLSSSCVLNTQNLLLLVCWVKSPSTSTVNRVLMTKSTRCQLNTPIAQRS